MISILEPVSIVVPIKNRGYLLPNLIKNLSNLNYSGYEIIIVDDCSTDNTKDILKKYPIKSISLNKSVGSAEARNIGIKEAKNKIIALTDSDCFVSRNWLNDLVPYLNKYDVVGGKVVYRNKAETKLNPFNRKNEAIIKKESSINFLNSCNMIFKKDSWHSIGGFLNFRIEDLEFSWRLLKKGFKLIYVPKGSVLHHHNRTPLQNIKKYFQYGKEYSKVASVHKMGLSFKTEPIFSGKSILDYLLLITFPFLLLLGLIIFNFIILNVIVNVSLDTLSLFIFIYINFRLIRKIDILYRLYKICILFSIANFTLIYMLKKKNNQ